MSNFVSGQIQTTMLRICFLLAFIGWAVAAQSEGGLVAPNMEIMIIQPARTTPVWLGSYRFNMHAAFTRSENNSTPIAALSGSSLQNTVADPKEAGTINTHLHSTPGSINLSPHLSFESKEDKVEIRPRRHSIWIIWRKALQ